MRLLASLTIALLLVACGGKTEDQATSDGGRSDGGAGDCTPGAKKSMDCNACTCTAEGFWSCTTMACVDAAADTGKCTPGESKKIDCNTCTCMKDGEWACTGLACVDAGSDSGSDPRCPSSWSAATSGSHDDLCPSIACSYPEGSCTCPAYCGGPPPGPDWKATWQCTPKRTDGCPETELTEGGSCSTPAKTCSYGACCTTQYTCTGGTWKKSGSFCPP